MTQEAAMTDTFGDLELSISDTVRDVLEYGTPSLDDVGTVAQEAAEEAVSNYMSEAADSLGRTIEELVADARDKALELLDPNADATGLTDEDKQALNDASTALQDAVADLDSLNIGSARIAVRRALAGVTNTLARTNASA